MYRIIASCKSVDRLFPFGKFEKCSIFRRREQPAPYDVIHVIPASDEDYFPGEKPINVSFFWRREQPAPYVFLTVAEKNYRNINRKAERFNKKVVDFRPIIWYHHAVS